MPDFYLSVSIRSLFVRTFLSGLSLCIAGCGGGDDSSATSTTTTDGAAAGATDGGAMAPGMTGMAGMDGAMPPADGGAMGATPNSGMAGMPGMEPGYAGAPGNMGGAGYTGAPGYDAAAGYGQGGIQQTPARPADVTTWSEKDYLEAFRDRDPRVLEAIDSKVKASPGDAKVAAFLTGLLTQLAVLKDAAPAQNAANPGYPGYNGAQPGGTSPGYAPPGYPGSDASAMPAGPVGNAPQQSIPQSSSPSGASSDGSSPTGSAIPGPTPAVSPQSSIRGNRAPNLAVDSLAIMFAESATAYLQNPAVGAIAGKDIAGSAAATAGSQSGAEYVPPGTSTGIEAVSGAMPGYPEGVNPGGTPPGSLDMKRVVEHIVNGLIENGSNDAWMALYGITAQTVRTPLPPAEATELVVHALYSHIHKNPAIIEPAILALVDGTAPVPPASRAAALRVTANVSGAAADRLIGIDPPGPPGPAGMGGPGGIGGPEMSMAGGAAAGMHDSTEGGYPGMAGGTAPGGAAPKAPPKGPPLPEAALIQSAKFIWSPKFTAALVRQLDAATDIGRGSDVVSGGDFVQIAASVPNSKVRDAVGALFLKSHSTGATILSSDGFFSNDVHDPGMLLVLKSLPRPKISRAAAQQGVAPDSWTMASQELVLALRDRLRAMAAKPGKLKPTGDTFPVRLHKNAIAEFSGMLSLPGTIGAGLNESAPSVLNVYYLRTSFTPQRPKDQEELADHYESRTSGQRRADQSRGILWIDGIKNTQSGAKRSMDVIIQAASSGGQAGMMGGAGGGPEMGGASGMGGSGTFSIEIIVVDSPEPKVAAIAADPAISKP